MTRSIAKDKRALSPVIATVILVSVTIVVAVSVAYWMGTISSGYTAFEQIELPTAYATYSATAIAGTNPGWKITIELKNTGSADATVDNMFLNAKPVKDYTSGTVYLNAGGASNETLSALSISVTKGTTKTLNLYVQKYDTTVTPATGVEGCTSGTRIDLKIHTAAGRDYPIQVKLP